MTELNPDTWDQRYQMGDHPWDLGCPAPPFIHLLEAQDAPLPGRIAVLGCGSGHDAMLFAEAGFDVVGIDFALSAIAHARTVAQARGLAIDWWQQDLFQLSPDVNQTFDYVLEHTCFCAIDPSLRSCYVQVVQRLLRPQGQLIALFYTHGRSGGPPYGVTPSEVLMQFEPDFEIMRFHPALDSIARRRGDEHLAIFQVRSA